MPRPNKTEQEHGYLMAFWKELKTLEADYVGSTAMFTFATHRPGVFTFRIVFTPMVGEGENYLGQQAVSFDYPTSQTQTLAGALWSASMKLTTLIFDAHQRTNGRPR
jgi:hypothetical protein